MFYLANINFLLIVLISLILLLKKCVFATNLSAGNPNKSLKLKKPKIVECKQMQNTIN